MVRFNTCLVRSAYLTSSFGIRRLKGTVVRVDAGQAKRPLVLGVSEHAVVGLLGASVLLERHRSHRRLHPSLVSVFVVEVWVLLPQVELVLPRHLSSVTLPYGLILLLRLLHRAHIRVRCDGEIQIRT